MSREAFTIAYDGPALADGAMDVRDLAPALMALGQLLDAANQNLNGDAAQIKLQVTATERGCFQISFEVIQSWSTHLLQVLATPTLSGAANLVTLVLGIGGTVALPSLIWLTKRLRGHTPDKAVKISDNAMRLTFSGETFVVPLELLRLYQDVAVRTAVQRLIEEPLKRDGIESFDVRKAGKVVARVKKDEARYFAKPNLPDEILIDEVRRSAFSILSLAFKEDNKWRLYDGNTQISATISDAEFLAKVDANQISFSKGDILICDVRVTQKRAVEGLRTDYMVERVLEHRPAARQLPLPLTEPIDGQQQAASEDSGASPTSGEPAPPGEEF